MDLFKQYCEDWATKYPHMQHVKGPESPNERFFFCFGYMGMTDAVRGLTPEQSPCMMMDVHVADLIGQDGHHYKDYTLYFCARADEQGDARKADLAVEECIQHKNKFIADIEALRKAHPVVGFIDTSNISGSSMGPFHDGWMCFEIMVRTPDDNCNTRFPA